MAAKKTASKKTAAKKTAAKKTTTKSAAKKTEVKVDKELEALAKETLTKKWGTGRERDIALRAAGHDPVAVRRERARLRASASE